MTQVTLGIQVKRLPRDWHTTSVVSKLQTRLAMSEGHECDSNECDPQTRAPMARSAYESSKFWHRRLNLMNKVAKIFYLIVFYMVQMYGVFKG